MARIVTGGLGKKAHVWELINTSWSCVRTLEGHTGQVISVAVSPDGEHVVTASHDKTARVWRLSDGACLHTLGHTAPVRIVAVGPDGVHVVTASGSDFSADKTARVWLLADGSRLRTMEGHTGQVQSVAVSPDGVHVVTASHDKTARVWRLSDGACLRTLEGHEDWVWSVAVSPDGVHVVTASADKTARIWRLSDGACRRTLEGHEDWVWSVAVSPDGEHVVTGSRDMTARVWRLSDGACLRTLEGHEDWVKSVAVSPDGVHVVTASRDKTARVWLLADAACLRTLEHTDAVWSVAFAPPRSLKRKKADDTSDPALPRQPTLLAAARHLLDNYFESPYPQPGAPPLRVPPSAALPADALLSEHESSHGVPRPNHGLANAVRKAALICPAATAYASGYVGTSELERSAFAFGDEQLLALEVAALFAAAGRESELSHSQDPVRHSAYKEVSCIAFEAYAESIRLPHRSAALQALRGMFASPDSFDMSLVEMSMSRVLEVAHDLDLFRCCTAAQMQPKLSSIRGELSQASSANEFAADWLLSQRAVDAIRATGDRLVSLPPGMRVWGTGRRPRHPDTFLSCSLGAEAPEACMRAALLLPPERTFATSRYKSVYAGTAMPKYAYQVHAALHHFLLACSETAELSPMLPPARVDLFYTQLHAQAVGAGLAAGGPQELLVQFANYAARAWTSALNNSLLATLLNRALAADSSETVLQPAAVLCRAINDVLCTRRRGTANTAWPEGPNAAGAGRSDEANVTFRGGGLPDEHRSFFTVGKKYRTTRFVATSFRRTVAERFVSRRPDPAVNKPILWTVRFHPTDRCMHVNYLQALSALDESEFLFPPYSVFTVQKVDWSASPLRVTLHAAVDNKEELEDLPLAPWS